MMKPNRHTTPMACAHAASAKVRSPIPAMKQETAARVAQRGPNVARRAIPPNAGRSSPSKRPVSVRPNRRPSEGKVIAPPTSYRYDDPDERVVSRGRIVDGRPGRMVGQRASAQPAMIDGDGDGRAETRRVEAPPPDERERRHTGEERHDHRSERVAGQQP